MIRTGQTGTPELTGGIPDNSHLQFSRSDGAPNPANNTIETMSSGTERAGVRDAIEALLEQFFAQQNFGKIRDGANPVAGKLTIAWAIFCLRSAQASLMLEEEGFSLQAAPILKSIMEHVATVDWILEHQEDAATVLNHHLEKYRAALLKSMESADWKISDLPQPGVKGDKPEIYGDFEGLTRRCSEALGQSSEVVYRILNSVSHPSVLTAAAYVEGALNDLDTWTFRKEAVPECEPEVLNALAVLLCWLFATLSGVVKLGDGVTERVQELEAELSKRAH